MFFGGTVVQLVSGPWIERLGFIAPYWFIFGCLLSAIIYAVVFVPESRVRCTSKRKQLFSLDNFTSSFLVYKDAVGNIRRNLILLTVSTGVLSITITSLSGVINLFTLHSPLCFSPDFVGYFSGFRQFIHGAGAVTTIKLLGVFLSDANVSRIAIVSYLGFLVYLAFATTPLMVFTSEYICMVIDQAWGQAIYVIYRPRGPDREKLCPRSWKRPVTWGYSFSLSGPSQAGE